MQNIEEEQATPRDLGMRILDIILGTRASERLTEAHEEEIIRLIDLGADLEVRSNVSQSLSLATPLFYVSSKGSRRLLEYMIKKGAELEARDRWSITSLARAAYFGVTDNVKALTEAGADPNTVNKSMYTLQITVGANGMKFFDKELGIVVIDSVASARVLIEAGADPRTAFTSVDGFRNFFDGDIAWASEDCMMRLKRRERSIKAFGRF